MGIGDNGGTDSRILISCAMSAENKVRHAPVVPKGRFLSQERLVQPRLLMGKDKILAIARKRS